MRSNQQNKNRSRGRNNNGRKHTNPLSRNYESNGPDVKVRGNASHVAEKYVQLARDATATGDLVMAENYLQHAEHYFRIVNAAQGQQSQRIDTSSDDFDADEFGDEMAGEREESAARGDNRTGQKAEDRAETADAAKADAGEPDEASKDAPKPRARRPRRVKVSEKGGEDKPAPRKRAAKKDDLVGELPAFLTASPANNAAE